MTGKNFVKLGSLASPQGSLYFVNVGDIKDIHQAIHGIRHAMVDFYILEFCYLVPSVSQCPFATFCCKDYN